MLKSMGERTPTCGTPDLNCRFVVVWFPPERRGSWIQFAQSPRPPTVAHQPRAGCIRLVHHIIILYFIKTIL